MIVPQNTLVDIETGEYSDRCTIAYVKTLREVDFKRLVTEFKHKKRIGDDGWPPGVHEMFVAWLVEQGYIEHIDVTSVHIGCYGRLEI